MDLLDEYNKISNGIIGERSSEEARYDNEVLRWIRKGKDIQKAIKKANQKYPQEAMTVDKENIDDVAAHYDYLLEHDNIMRKISH